MKLYLLLKKIKTIKQIEIFDFEELKVKQNELEK